METDIICVGNIECGKNVIGSINIGRALMNIEWMANHFGLMEKILEKNVEKNIVS